MRHFVIMQSGRGQREDGSSSAPGGSQSGKREEGRGEKKQCEPDGGPVASEIGDVPAGSVAHPIDNSLTRGKKDCGRYGGVGGVRGEIGRRL